MLEAFSPQLSGHYYYHGYNILPAADARRMLLHETHLMSELLREVYHPVQNALKEMSQTKASVIEMLHSAPYVIPGIPGTCVDLELITAKRTIYHIGTVASHEHMLAAFNKETVALLKQIDGCEAMPNPFSIRLGKIAHGKYERFLELGPLAITRNWHQCLIPIDRPMLDNHVVLLAARKFLSKSNFDELVNRPIVLLRGKNRALAEKLYFEIDSLGRRLAVHQSNEEREEIIIQDLQES